MSLTKQLLAYSQSDAEQLVTSLLTSDRTACQNRLNALIPTLDAASILLLINQLKKEADKFLRSEIQTSLAIGEMIRHIADLTGDPLHTVKAIAVEANAYGHGGLGRYEEAAVLYDEAAAIYVAQEDEVMQAAAFSASLIPLIHLGQDETVFDRFFNAEEILQRHNATFLLAKLYVNMGVLYRRRGQDVRSLEMDDEARRLYAMLPDNEAAQQALSRVEQNRAASLRRMGRFEEAITASQQAWQMLHNSGQVASAARAKQNLAITYLALGRYNEALALLDQVRDIFLHDGRSRDSLLVELFTSDCLLQLGRFTAVLEKCGLIRSQFTQFGTHFEVAQALLNEATAFAGLHQFDQALASLADARTRFAQAEYPTWVASTDLEKAFILLQQHKAAESLTTALAATAVFAEHNFPLEQAYAYLLAARAALQMAQYDIAVAHLHSASDLVRDEDIPLLTYQQHHLLGQIAATKAQPESAKMHYETAVTALERLRGRLMIEFRADFLEDKLAIYEDLALLHLDEANPASSFETAERAKSRALLELLTFRLNLGIAARSPEDEPLVAELKQLRAERDEIYQRWQKPEITDARGTTQSLTPELKNTQNDVLQIESRITDLWHRLLVHNADYARDAALWQVRTEPVQPYLAPDTALVEYFVIHNRFVAYIVTSDSITAHPLGCTTDELKQSLERLWLNLRTVPKYNPALLPRLTANLQAHLQRLHGCLFAPLQDALSSFEKLIIVPHGPLHYLPFHALWDGTSYLLTQFEMSYLPSASLLHYGRSPQQHDEQFVTVGYSNNGRLPYATQEAAAIAQQWNGRSFLEAAATASRFKEAAASAQVLHLATHAEYRPDNPLFSGLSLADGWLTTLDIFNWQLTASLVTLSACQTGRSVISGGDELLGLMRAFLSAGAASLVLSLWAVADESTAVLMSAFYQNLADGMSKSRALQQAQISLATGENAALHHPYFWAPFYLIGDNGRL